MSVEVSVVEAHVKICSFDQEPFDAWLERRSRNARGEVDTRPLGFRLALPNADITIYGRERAERIVALLTEALKEEWVK